MPPTIEEVRGVEQKMYAAREALLNHIEQSGAAGDRDTFDRLLAALNDASQKFLDLIRQLRPQ
jgi:hypothetical protein